MDDAPPSLRNRTRRHAVELSYQGAERPSKSGAIRSKIGVQQDEVKINPATSTKPSVLKFKKLSAVYDQQHLVKMVQGSASTNQESENHANMEEDIKPLSSNAAVPSTPVDEASPPLQEESAQDHPTSSVNKFEMLLRSAELEGKPAEDGQTPTSAGPREPDGQNARLGLPQSPGLPPVPRKSFGSGKPYVPEGWSWRIVTDDFTKSDHYWSDVKYFKDGTNIMFQRRRPLVQYFIELNTWTEEAATQYVNREFPRMRALLPADTAVYHPRKRSHKDSGTTDQGSEHNSDVLSSGSGDIREEGGAGNEADGRAQKRVATREFRRNSDGDIGVGKSRKMDDFSPHVGMSRSVASLAQEVAMKRIFSALESRERAAKKLREFLSDSERWSNLEANGTTHLELFEFLRSSRTSDPQQLREYQELFLKHELSKDDLEMEKRDVLQLLTVLVSHSEGVKQQNKSQLVDAIVNSPPWRTYAAGQTIRRKVNHRKEASSEKRSPIDKDHVVASGSSDGQIGSKEEEGSGQGEAKAKIEDLSAGRDQNGLDLSLALGSTQASGGIQNGDSHGKSDRDPGTSSGPSSEVKKTLQAAIKPGADDAAGHGLISFPGPGALRESGLVAGVNDAGPSDAAVAALGEEGTVALQDVKKHELDLKRRLQAQAEHKQTEASADVEAAKQAKEAASAAEKELEEARVRLKKAEAGAKAARAKVKETAVKATLSAEVCRRAESTLKERLVSVEKKARECEAALVQHLGLQKQLEAVPKMPRDDEGMSAYVRFHVAVAESLKEYQTKRRELEAFGPRHPDIG